MKHLFTKNRLISLASVMVLLIVWKLAAVWLGSPLVLPPPEEALLTTFRVIGGEGFPAALLTTVFRGLLGFALSLAAALLLGIWAGISSSVHAAIKPLLVSLRSTPVISFILLALIWFRVDQVPVFIAFLTMFPIVCTNIIEGIRSTEKELVEMALFYRVPRNRVITEVYIPGIAPFLTSGISTAIGFGWRAVIIGEVLSQPRWGIGTEMQQSQTYLLVSELIAWTVIAILVSYLFELMVRYTERKLIRWRN